MRTYVRLILLVKIPKPIRNPYTYRSTLGRHQPISFENPGSVYGPALDRGIPDQDELITNPRGNDFLV